MTEGSAFISREPDQPQVWRFPPVYCPRCGAEQDAALPAPGSDEGRTLGDGDYMICLHCTQINVLVLSGTIPQLRLMTAQELREVQQGPDYDDLMSALYTLRRRWGKD